MLKAPVYLLSLPHSTCLMINDMEICSICGVLDMTPGGSWQMAPQFDEGQGGGAFNQVHNERQGEDVNICQGHSGGGEVAYHQK